MAASTCRPRASCAPSTTWPGASTTPTSPPACTPSTTRSRASRTSPTRATSRPRWCTPTAAANCSTCPPGLSVMGPTYSPAPGSRYFPAESRKPRWPEMTHRICAFRRQGAGYCPGSPLSPGARSRRTGKIWQTRRAFIAIFANRPSSNIQAIGYQCFHMLFGYASYGGSMWCCRTSGNLSTGNVALSGAPVPLPSEQV